MSQQQASKRMWTIKQVTTSVLLAAVVLCAVACEAKLLRRSRYYDDYNGGGYAGGSHFAGPTGERALLTVRGARNPYDGSAPQKIAIEDNPYRGAYPRGVYDRLDGGYGGGARYPMRDPYGSGYGPYGGGYGGYMHGGSGYGHHMYGAPNRIAVTGAFPYGYGSRF